MMGMNWSWGGHRGWGHGAWSLCVAMIDTRLVFCSVKGMEGFAG